MTGKPFGTKSASQRVWHKLKAVHRKASRIPPQSASNTRRRSALKTKWGTVPWYRYCANQGGTTFITSRESVMLSWGFLFCRPDM